MIVGAQEDPAIYWIDHLSSMVELKYGAHGYASYFCMSLMDRYWKQDLNLEEAKELMRKCLAELKTRFLGNFPEFIIKVVSKDGIEQINL